MDSKKYPDCPQTPFEHNKGIFSVGQCPYCYRSDVINPKTEEQLTMEANAKELFQRLETIVQALQMIVDK